MSGTLYCQVCLKNLSLPSREICSSCEDRFRNDRKREDFEEGSFNEEQSGEAVDDGNN